MHRRARKGKKARPKCQAQDRVLRRRRVDGGTHTHTHARERERENEGIHPSIHPSFQCSQQGLETGRDDGTRSWDPDGTMTEESAEEHLLILTNSLLLQTGRN